MEKGVERVGGERKAGGGGDNQVRSWHYVFPQSQHPFADVRTPDFEVRARLGCRFGECAVPGRGIEHFGMRRNEVKKYGQLVGAPGLDVVCVEGGDGIIEGTDFCLA